MAHKFNSGIESTEKWHGLSEPEIDQDALANALKGVVLTDVPNFENDSCLETYYEVSTFIERKADEECGVAYDTICSQGRGGLYTLAKMWTDEFEQLHIDRQWDGEWLEVLDEFINNKNELK
jgi:hypothetical protein